MSRAGRQGTIAAAALAAFGAVFVPRPAGERPGLPRVESWVAAACGGEEACGRWETAARLAELLADRMPGVEEDERVALATAIAEESDAARLDPLLVLAMIEVESGFDAEAVSRRGAVGLMQLRPATLRREAERHGLGSDDGSDPILNVRAGIRYFRRVLDSFRGDLDTALMAYNAGPMRISRLRREEGGIPDRFRGYVRRVRAEHRELVAAAAPRVALLEAAPVDPLR